MSGKEDELDLLELDIAYKKAIIELSKWLPTLIKALPQYKRSIDGLSRALNNMPHSLRLRP